MPQPKTIDTPENWDAASQAYSEKIAPFLMESFARDFIDLLDADDSHEALEVATGSGALTLEYAKRVKSLLATDFAPKMLELAKQKCDRSGISNVAFEVMDGQSLTLEDNSMDRVASSFGLMLFPDRNRGFAELHRVLRPGGKAMVSAWAGPDQFEALGLFLKAIQQAFPDLPKPATPPPVFSLSDPAIFRSEMEAAGFQDVEVTFIAKDLSLKSVDECWSMLTTGAPPVKMLFDLVGEGGRGKIHDTLADIIEQRFGSGPFTITNTATVGTGRKI